jgi:DNA-binding PadR family transcriptional regulator
MRSKSIPALTNLHYLVLGVLRSGEQPGRVIRRALTSYGVRRSAPAFYQLMARLEASSLVEGWYEQTHAGDQMVVERRYRITADGSRAFNRAREFYSEVEQLASRVRWSDA